MDQLTIGKILMKVNDLPSLPFITNRVIELTENPRSTPEEICQVILQDQVIALKVLKLVNSAYYGLPRKIASIQEAITILGMQTLRTLVLGASIVRTLSSAAAQRSANHEKMWRHAAACAVAGKLLAERTGILPKENAFVAGLLHDLGKIIFHTFLYDEYAKAIALSDSKKITLYEAEKEVMGFTHAEMGKLAAEKWNLPVNLVEPLGYHHEPFTSCVNQELVQVIYLADIISVMAGYGSIGSQEYNLDAKVLTRLKVSHEQMYYIADEIKDKISIDFL